MEKSGQKFSDMYEKPIYNNLQDDNSVILNEVGDPQSTISDLSLSKKKITNENIDPNNIPKYDYLKKVPKIIKYKKGNLYDAIYGIEDNIARTAGILITGKENCPKKNSLQIGEKSYFISGTCGENSSPECIGAQRNIIVDNLPENSNNGGLIPSIINDFGAFEPVELLKSMNGNGNIVNDKCILKNIEIKQLNPDKKPFSLIKKLCVPDNTFIENFTNINPDSKDKYNSYILIILLCLLLSLYCSKK